MTHPPDFSSADYWTTRFLAEKSFEWLVSSAQIIPLVRSSIHDVGSLSANDHKGDGDIVNILHFGCGTSSLGSDIHEALAVEGDRSKFNLVDGDYAASTIETEHRTVPLVEIDVMDHESLESKTRQLCKCKGRNGDRDDTSGTSIEDGKDNRKGEDSEYDDEGGDELWDILVDKSTADAICCGPDIPLKSPLLPHPIGSQEEQSVFGPSSEMVQPIIVLCRNLARVTKRGGRWISISYSSSRFDHLTNPHHLNDLTHPHNPNSASSPTFSMNEKVDGSWRVIEKEAIPNGSPTTREVDDGRGGLRIVYEPETSVWVYILERV